VGQKQEEEKMWLSKRNGAATGAAADVGLVSVGAEAPAVVTDAEARSLRVFAPGGYCWRPAAGQAVLVLQAGSESVVAGASMASGAGLREGEVLIYAPGGASIRLGCDGSLALTGNVTVNGAALTGGGSDGTETQ
jgi:hypothetical protein